MFTYLIPDTCRSCGKKIPRAAARRCPICLTPFRRVPVMPPHPRAVPLPQPGRSDVN